MHLGVERHCENKVSRPRTQRNVPGHEPEPGTLHPETSATNHEATAFPRNEDNLHTTSHCLLASTLTYHTARGISAQSSTKMKYESWRGNKVEWRRKYVAFIKIRHPHPGSGEFPLNICVVLWEKNIEWTELKIGRKIKTIPNLKNLKLGILKRRLYHVLNS